MALIMLISLFTSRVVLDVLGTSDYGLYNVVGGVVAMMGFLNGSISAGTSRFITYELGIGDLNRLRNVFNVTLVSHIVIALIVFIIAETVGLWFVNTQMTFTEDRTVAVNIVYQLSVVTAMLQLTQMPYTADIIAHEKMSIYAYVSILEVILRLAMVISLMYIHNVDLLIAYSIMIFFTHLIVLIIYRCYCTKKYEESHWRFVRNVKQYKAIFSFAGWDIIGGLCVITQGQGINILLNIYFGPVINAARAISYQVQGAFTQFTSNFMTAVNPVIVKSYARKEYDTMIRLINNASLYSFFLLLVFMMPVLFKIEVLFNIWLKEIPDDTVCFTVIILVLTMIRAIARPIIVATHATGNIKTLNLYAGILGLFPLPISWVVVHYGASAVVVFWVIFLWGIFANVAEIIILKMRLPKFSILNHFYKVYVRCLIVSIVSVIICFCLNKMFNNTFWEFCIYYASAFALSCVVVFYIGLTKELRAQIEKKIKYGIYKINQWDRNAKNNDGYIHM